MEIILSNKNSNNCNGELNSSEKFKALLSGGINEPGDCRTSFLKPEWLDHDLFEKGRNFYKKYFFCLIFSELLGLLLISTFKRLLVPLMFTKYSNTPRKALKRYMSTTNHLITWFEEDVWDPSSKGHEDIMGIRTLHLKIANQMKKESTDLKEIYESMENCVDNECPFSEFFQNSSLRKNHILNEVNLDSGKNFSQFDMVITQYCFIGLIITHPRKLGLHWVNQFEMMSIIHYWRGIGWLLGIEDRYNLCSGSLEDVMNYCKEIELNLIIPKLMNLTTPSINHADNIMKGINRIIPGVSNPSMFLYTFSIFNISGFRRYVSWRHFSYYLLMKAIFGFLFLNPWWIKIFNSVLRYAIRLYNKRVNLAIK